MFLQRTNDLVDGAKGAQERRLVGAQNALAGGVQQLPLAIDEVGCQRLLCWVEALQLAGQLVNALLVVWSGSQASTQWLDGI
jgi:hypothetical protein